ncbi:MAG: YfjI family protein [Bryobacteraceae bacterium]
MQVPLDYPAAVAVVSLAGSVNRRAMIQPKARDTGFKVVPNLWGGIVGRPGHRKSPVMEAVARPLKDIQKRWFDEHAAATIAYKKECELNALRVSAWKQNATSAFRNGHTQPERPEELQEQKKCRRLLIGDATFEALHKAMEENPEGLLVLRDELSGWLAQLDKPGREGERAFCLEAWNGNSGFIVDRIERGTINVPYVCMSLVGGIQPARLRSYMSDSVDSGPGDDGLIQRFQVLVWPDPSSDWDMVDREPDVDAEKQVSRVYGRLVELSADQPILFRFAPDAQELFFEWYREVELKIRRGDLHDALAAHLSKYVSLMPSLALLFALADQAAAGVWSSQVVCLDHAKKAAAWCHYLESHARRVYSTVVSPQRRAAADLVERIKRGEVGKDGTVAVREIYRHGWSGLDTHDRAAAAVLVLQDHDWLRELVVSGPRPSGGRRGSARYQINPKAARRA